MGGVFVRFYVGVVFSCEEFVDGSGIHEVFEKRCSVVPLVVFPTVCWVRLCSLGIEPWAGFCGRGE